MKEQALKAILKILIENTRATGNPLGVPHSECLKWRQGLQGGRGEYLYFTGCLYQLAPYIVAYRQAVSSLVSKPGLAGLASRLGGLSRALSRIALRPPKSAVERFNAIPLRIYKLLEKAGVSVTLGYDEYSGILLYDMGLDDAFAEHAAKVYRGIKSAGTSKVVTIDPHTYYALKIAYPKFIDGYDLEVYHYTELLAGSSLRLKALLDTVSVHDSCYLARHLRVLDSVRRAQGLVDSVEYRYPEASGVMTGCCGGPVEVVFPKLSERIAESRVEELAVAGGRAIVAFCPICIVNLERPAGQRGLKVLDFSELVEVA